MAERKIRADELDEAISEALKEYALKIDDTIQEATKKAVRKGTSELRKVSPGSYAKYWRHKANKSRLAYSETIYNDRYAWLTHLLEFPHKTGNGGNYPSHKGSKTDHTGQIASVDKMVVEEFLDELEKKI